MMANHDGRRAGAGNRDTPSRPERRPSACVIVGQVLGQQLDVPSVEAVLAAIRGDDRPVAVEVIGVVCS